MKNLYVTVLVMLSGVIFPENTLAQITKSKEIENYIHNAEKLGLFNGNILVAEQGRVIFKASIGYADASKKNLLTEDYRFHIGSIAKEFNAVAIMMLKEQGKLNLSDKVSKFLPDLPDWSNKISVKNLLQYTSGLPDVNWKTVQNDRDNWNDLKALKSLDFEPGTKYAYNNNNVFLQRRIIEKLSGITFKEFVEEKILKPNGIKKGIIDPTETDTLIAKSYNDDFIQDKLVYPISGWTCLDINDFYKWSNCLTNFSVIDASSTKEILIPMFPNGQSGLGQGVLENGKLLRHIHDGSARNYKALCVMDAKNERTILVLVNQTKDNIFKISNAIESILDGKPYEQLKKSILREHQKELEKRNGVQILSFYKDLKSKKSQDYEFSNENTLNEIGYFCLTTKKASDAISVFEYNTKLFPKSGNVYDSLAEAFYKDGDYKKSLFFYKKSLTLDPSNQNAKDMIEELNKKQH